MMTKLALLLIILTSFASSSAHSQTDMSLLNQGEKALRELEPQFMSTPVYLINDDELKRKLKESLIAAIELIEKAHEENPSKNRALLLLGKAYSFGHDLNMPGAWQKSTKYLEEYMQLEPGNYKAYLYLGKNYMDAERFEDAYRTYQSAYALEPQSEAGKFIALSLMFQKKTPEAITAMKSYVFSHPADKDAVKMLQALEEGRFTM